MKLSMHTARHIRSEVYNYEDLSGRSYFRALELGNLYDPGCKIKDVF